jgi:hypothetical protein
MARLPPASASSSSSAELARLKKQANDTERSAAIDPPTSSLLSDNYAAAIRDEVLEELGRPKDAKKPTVTGIRRAIDDGSLFQTDPQKGFALKD